MSFLRLGLQSVSLSRLARRWTWWRSSCWRCWWCRFGRGLFLGLQSVSLSRLARRWTWWRGSCWRCWWTRSCNLFCSCAHIEALCVAYSAFFIRSGVPTRNQACLLYVTCGRKSHKWQKPSFFYPKAAPPWQQFGSRCLDILESFDFLSPNPFLGS